MDIEAVRTLVETDLPDGELQVLIDDAEQAVETRAPAGERTVHLTGGTKTLGLPVPAVVGEVVESDITLTVDDHYRVENGGMTLRRLHRRWGRHVKVTYTPAAQDRTRVVVDLVKLAIAWSGYTMQTAGDWRGEVGDYQHMRERILESLDRGRQVV